MVTFSNITSRLQQWQSQKQTIALTARFREHLAWLFQAVIASVVGSSVLNLGLSPISPSIYLHSWSYFLSDNEILDTPGTLAAKNTEKQNPYYISFYCHLLSLLAFAYFLGPTTTKPRQQWSGLLSRHKEHATLVRVCHQSVYFVLNFNKHDYCPTSKAHCWLQPRTTLHFSCLRLWWPRG